MVSFITLIIGFSLGWSFQRMDVTAAFLDGEIDQELYIKFSYNLPTYKLVGKTYRIHKSLYSLKQTPLLWYCKLRWFLLTEIIYKILGCDSSAFFKRDDDKIVKIILAYVDDLIFISNNPNSQNANVTQFLKRLEGTEEPLNWCLGVHVVIKIGKMKFHKLHILIECLHNFELQSCRAYKRPMPSSFYDDLELHKKDNIVDGGNIETLLAVCNFSSIDLHPTYLLLSEFSHSTAASRLHFL